MLPILPPLLPPLFLRPFQLGLGFALGWILRGRADEELRPPRAGGGLR